MKHKSLTQNISFLLFYSFALVGFLTTVVFFHELSHKRDFSDKVANGVMAIFIIPDNITLNSFFSGGAIGTYSYNYNLNDSQEVERIGRYTESKAYSITFIILLLFILVEVIVITKWMGWREDEKE